jgi:hypothetical protein
MVEGDEFVVLCQLKDLPLECRRGDLDAQPARSAYEVVVVFGPTASKQKLPESPRHGVSEAGLVQIIQRPVHRSETDPVPRCPHIGVEGLSTSESLRAVQFAQWEQQLPALADTPRSVWDSSVRFSALG